MENNNNNNQYIRWEERKDYGVFTPLVEASKKNLPLERIDTNEKVNLINRNDAFYLGLVNGSSESFIKSIIGHDCVCMDDVSTHTYYVIDGFGDFEIDGKTYGVGPNSVVTIPPGKEFTYCGNMTMILKMDPPFNEKTNHRVREIQWDGNVPIKK